MLKIDEKDKPMWLWVFDIIKAMDSGCGILVGHHVHFDGPVANSTEYIIKSEYDKLKAELKSVRAENRMLKSSDHVRETFKAKEINELRDILQRFYKLNVSNRFPLNGAEKTNEELCTAYEVLVEKNK